MISRLIAFAVLSTWVVPCWGASAPLMGWDTPGAQTQSVLELAQVGEEPKIDPPALPVGDLGATLQVTQEVMKAGETFQIEGEIRPFPNKEEVKLPNDLADWKLGIHQGDDDFFEIPIRFAAGNLPEKLKKGESLKFTAELPVDRLSIYAKRIVDGKASYAVKGPVPPSRRATGLIAGRVTVTIEIPEAELKRWTPSQSRYPGYFGGQDASYAEGEVVLMFDETVSLEEAEGIVAGMGARIHKIAMYEPGYPAIIGVSILPELTVEEAIERFNQNKKIKVAVRNAIGGRR